MPIELPTVAEKILFLLLYCEFCSLAVSHFSVAFEMMFCLVLPPDSMKILAKNAEHCYRHKRCLCSLLSPNPCHPIHFLSTGTRCFFSHAIFCFCLIFFRCHFLPVSLCFTLISWSVLRLLCIKILSRVVPFFMCVDKTQNECNEADHCQRDFVGFSRGWRLKVKKESESSRALCKKIHGDWRHARSGCAADACSLLLQPV